MVDPVAWYDANAETVVVEYEKVAAGEVNGWLLDLLPDNTATVLDIGAGSGRDAAWFAAKGFDVIAVEPSASMRSAAASLHSESPIRWIDDRLPALNSVTRSGISFDVIILNAMWMHLTARDRPRAFRKVINLLKSGGVLAMTLRIGPEDQRRGIHSVSPEEIETLARDHGAFIEKQDSSRDLLSRDDIRWVRLAIRLPDDGTGALPLLRHVILNDTKSSTYKLALLRTLCRVANGSAGLARDHDDDFVAVPLGLIALTWIRLFKPLLSAGLPQNPSNIGLRRLRFVREAYRKLVDVSHFDLRVGMRFSSETAGALHQALKDAASTIDQMPATYLTFPNGGQVFPVNRSGRVSQPGTFQLDQPYLSSFGEMLVPRNLWKSLQRFDVWIEPAIVAEWSNLIESYAARQGTKVEFAQIRGAMKWEEPSREVRLARERALDILAHGHLFCVWSGRNLNEKNLDIDHCFPWTVWPCGDLWNLMPAHRTVNQNQKKAKLPADRLLRTSQERVIDWWESAYENMPVVSDQFWLEAESSLPCAGSSHNSLNDIFDAVCLRRIRLKHDQQVPEWSG